MIFKRPNRIVSRVFIHCSASDNPNHDDVSVIRKWHLEKGWSDVGYHFFIKKDGTVQVGRPIEKIPAAQKGHNTGSIAICLHGLKEELFTDKQRESLKDLCVQIAKAYPEGITFHGHCEVEPLKTCPVVDYKKWLSLDQYGKMTFNVVIPPVRERVKLLKGRKTCFDS